MKKLRQSRYGIGTVCGLAVLATAGILSATAFTGSSSPHASPGATLDTSAPPVNDRPAYDWNASPMPGGIAVASMVSARAHLPFALALPGSTAAPSSMYVTDPSKGDTGEQGFAAVVHDPKYGVFQVFEQQTPMTESQLEAWAQACNTCTIQKVAVVGARHFLILSSPGHGLAVSWLTGSVLHTIMGPEQTLREAAALSLASNTPATGG